MNRSEIHSDALRHLRRIMLRLCLAVLAASCIAACVRDDADSGGPGRTDDADAAGWIIYQVMPWQDNETRADDDTSNGTPDEYAIAPGNYHFILFYEKGNDNAAPMAVLSMEDAGNYAPDVSWATRMLIAIYPISQDQMDDFQQFLTKFEAMALLNFDPKQNLGSDEAAWDDLEKITITRSQLKAKLAEQGTIQVNDTKYFTMTSSTYQNSEGDIVYASESRSNKVYETKARALTAALSGEANIVSYVERVVAKVVPFFAWESGKESGNYLYRQDPNNTQINLFAGFSDDDRYDIRTTQRHWNAKLVGYGINGLEQSSFLFKKISAGGYRFNGSYAWNNPDRRRSHWAEDPHYEINANYALYYPHQYRAALEATDTLRDYHRTRDERMSKDFSRRLLTYAQNDYGSVDHVPQWDDEEYFTLTFMQPNSSYYLRYVSFDDLMTAEIASTAQQQAFYPLENTYDDSNGLLSQRGYFTAGTHLLVACQLEIDGVTPASDLYKDQNDIFYTRRDDLLEAKFKLVTEKALKGGNSGLNILHVNWYDHQPDANYLRTLEWPVDSKLYIERHGDTAPGVWSEWMDEASAWLDLTLIPAELTGGDGQLLIAPKWHNNKFAIGTAPGADDFQEISYDEIISLFHKLVGPIDHYRKGYMYYAAPVGHNARNNDEWKSTQVGSVGVVRNHYYQLHVNGVSQPGRSVDMTAQPIIPLLDVKRDYIDVSVKILDWHGTYQDRIPMYPTQ